MSQVSTDDSDTMDVEHEDSDRVTFDLSTSSQTDTKSRPEDISKVWMDKFKEGILTASHFKEHWRYWVPQLFNPELTNLGQEWMFDEQKSQAILFDTLEQFICDGNPQEVLTNLSRLDNPPSVCGRVFKMGEPSYHCRECGMDATCVLCVDCFKKSSHRNHKYKMGTSIGGGCCDCGDVEAWKTEPYCEVHIAGLNKKSDSAGGFTDDLVARTRIVFSCVLRYAYRLLTVEYQTSLPADLRLKEADENPFLLGNLDKHCTVLYNDETHTFEQVINTLARLIKCSQKDAIEFVTNIDREGRAVVKCSTFQYCNELKSEIERFTSRHASRPLKVLVVHSHLIAHQSYALRLLTWLQKVVNFSEGFRTIFKEVAMEINSPDTSIIEGILLRDSTLWKSARLHWHRLFISGMLMEYESKKAFAIVFTKHYASVMKDFIRDDHDHSFSVASLAVQIFTVPTLAHYLIAYESVLYNLMNTFISECSRKLNKNNKLEFERNVQNVHFKRAQFVLYDLRYLLGVAPEVWTDDLRKGFLHAFSLFLDLLTYMQGMDAVTRQVGQHMEYEPEWESAFNLHIKLSPVITLMLKWCGSDKVVLVKAYRATLRKLYENPSFDPTQPCEVRELADHSASCLQYDVSSQPVSIHLPLSRFLAGLHLHLERFDLEFDSPEFSMLTKQTPEQIIEPVLRTQVMIAQVHAGMWRRNGYSLLNQLYFYHNVKCRSEMLDKDIVLLQIGAFLIEANEFLIHLLNKFNLTNWANPQFEVNAMKNPEEDSIRQTISLVEEFLRLLVTIIGERYNPGVGKVQPDDCIKKEIIQQLCIKPLPHSELNKTLPDDVNHETGLERVINQVAEFKKPTVASGKGVYELKPEFYDQYNVFFYHYTREELSKSEEEQRKRRKAAGELECCPPPALPPLSDSFSVMANLLQSDVMLHIMNLVLTRSVNLRARSFSETQLHKVLHLIGYALQEEERNSCQFLTFTLRADKWELEPLIEELCTSPRVEAHKDLLQWTLAKFRKVAAAWRETSKGGQEGGSTEGVPGTSEVPSGSTSTSGDVAREEKEWRAKMAAERRAKIMAHMTALQKSFMKEHAKDFESARTLSEKSVSESQEQMVVGAVALDAERSPVALGPHQTPRVNTERTYTCILCQEDQAVILDGPALVLAAFVQKSTVLSHKRQMGEGDEEEKDIDSQPMFPSSNLGPAPHTSTCGHVMHSHCWQRYFENVLARENRRPYRLRHPTSFDVEKNEFLCPLCECLNNTVLPLIPPLGTFQQPTPSVEANFDNWLQSIQIALRHKQKRSHKAKSGSSSKQDNSASSATACSSGSKPQESQSQQSQSQSSSRSNDDSISGSSTAANTTSSANTHAMALSVHQSSEGENDSVTDLWLSDSEMDYDESGEGEEGSLPSTRHYPMGESDFVMQLYILAARNGNSAATANAADGNTAATAQPAAPILMLSTSLLEMIHLFSQATYTKGLGVNPHQLDCRVPLMAWRSCAYTIHSLEWLLRDTDKPLLGNLSCRKQDCLEALIRVSAILGSTWKQEQVINSHALRLLSIILETPSQNSQASILDWDSFGMLVLLTMSMPSLFYTEQPVPVPLGTTLELYTLNLMLIATFAQIVIISDVPTEEVMEDEEEEEGGEDSTECLKELYKILRGTSEVDTRRLWRMMKDKSIPFLRCCALFYHFLTDVPAPAPLKTSGGDTFEALCSYLGLSPLCKDLIAHDSVTYLAKKWAQHDDVKAMVMEQGTANNEQGTNKEQVGRFRDLTKINRLVNLPEDYSELINTVSMFICPNSDREDSRNPTMCLVCGEMLCSQSYCCQTQLKNTLVGACTSHAYKCGAGACVFLRVRECEVLLLASPNRGCFMTPPYLDDYGETDQGLRRGNPLKLCRERYRKLQLLWLGHGIHEQIARAIEASTNLVSTQWQHL